MVSTPLSKTDQQYLAELRHSEGMSVSQLCEAADVTATAVRQRLSRLEAMGYVERRIARTGRGRPRYLYYVTERGIRLLGDNYTKLAILLWRKLNQIENQSVREQVLGQVRKSLIDLYGQAVTSEDTATRIHQLLNGLKEQGFDVEITASAPSGTLPVLKENHCPYHELASEDPSICELELSVFEEVLGADVTLKSCCLSGAHCCEFEIQEKQAS